MILVDTGPLVAICDPRDPRHRNAVRDLDRLLPSGLCVCEAVLVEAAFHLPAIPQRRRLQRLLEYSRAVPVGGDDPALRSDVFDWLIKYGDHRPDWADGCLAVLSGRDPRRRVWTYDVEFRTIWRRPDGSSIPVVRRR